jgi:hypothetical protein
VHRYDQMSMSLWKSGAYRAASFDSGSGRGALVEHDGGQSMRSVGVTADGFEETVATTRAIRGGLHLRVSTLRGYRDGSLEWRWRVTRPGLRREEILSVDARGNFRFRQTDRRPGRTTTFRSTGRGRYEGVTTTRDGEVLWTSAWERDRSGGMRGSFTSASGEPAGDMRIPGREQREAGEKVSWSGPDSSGSIAFESSGSGGSLLSIVTGGGNTRTFPQKDGHVIETGSDSSGSWVKDTGPEDANGDSYWTEIGTQNNPNSPTGKSDYTINGVTHQDGSSSSERHDTNPITGEVESTFTNTDKDKNSSWSSSETNPNGTVTIVTHTVDANKNGTEHVTVVDPQGNVIKDETSIVQGGVVQPTGATPGGPGAPGAATPPTNTPTDPDEPAEPEDPDDDDPDDPDDPDDDDPDDADDPDEPDSPDDGGDGGGEMGNPDGPDDDGRPGIPWGKIGHRGGDFDDGFAGLRGLGSGGGDDDEATTPGRVDAWREGLGREIGGAAGGGAGGGGGADETGWGNGGEGFRGVPLVAGSGRALPPGAADDSGWGDLNDPRALVAFIQSFSTASAALARSGALASAVKR